MSIAPVSQYGEGMLWKEQCGMMAINAVQIHNWYQWEMRIYFNNQADLNLTIIDIYNVPMLTEHIGNARIDCETNLFAITYLLTGSQYLVYYYYG